MNMHYDVKTNDKKNKNLHYKKAHKAGNIELGS